MNKRLPLIIFTAVIFPAIIIVLLRNTAPAGIERSTYTVLNTYPHDREAFTQGLFFKDGYFYESTGLWGRSSLRKVAMETGRVEKIHELPERYFGEGTTFLDGKIYQLTWRSRVGFIYDPELNPTGTFHYGTEGWGLTNDGRRLIMSDGSHHLYFLDAQTLEVTGKIEVTLENEPVKKLNELQYVKGKIYANVWKEDCIVIIDPDSGVVTGIIDLEGIIDPNDYDHELDVLNGIAYDEAEDRLFVTGKLWPLIFEIEIVVRE